MYLETYGYSHILGGLYGQALGDAWGMPALLHPAHTWDYHQGWLEEFLPGPMDHPIHAGLRAGQVTGNTQQAMALAQAIIEKGEITVEGAAQAIVSWYDQHDGDNTTPVGSCTHQAVLALKAGGDPQQTGLRGDTNGGASRISPIGLIHPGQPEAAVQDTIIACTPTHFTDVAISGACAVAAAVAEAMVPDATLEDIIEMAIWGASTGRRYGSPWLGASVARKIDYAVQLASDPTLSEYERIQNLYDLIGATLASADSVPCAFGILTLSDGNPIDTAVYAAALSGNANIIGAMACAIAGAWHGIESIPREYTQILHQANPQLDFETTATSLHEIALQNEASIPPSNADTDLLADIFSQGG